MRLHPALLVVLAALGALSGGAPAGAGAPPTFLGPTPYLSQADSPFALGNGDFCLETFEATADAIQADARRLKGALVCPGST